MGSPDSAEESTDSSQRLRIIGETSNRSPPTPFNMSMRARRFSSSNAGSQGLPAISEPSNLSPTPAFNERSRGLPIISEPSNLSPIWPYDVRSLGLPVISEPSNLSPRPPFNMRSSGLPIINEPSNLSPRPAFNVRSQGLPIEPSNLSPTRPSNVRPLGLPVISGPSNLPPRPPFNVQYQGLPIISEPSNLSPTPPFNVPSQGWPINGETSNLSPALPFNVYPDTQRVSVLNPGSQGLPIISETSNMSYALPYNLPPHARRFFGLDSYPHPFMSPGVQPHRQRTPLVRTNFPPHPFINHDQGNSSNESVDAQNILEPYLDPHAHLKAELERLLSFVRQQTPPNTIQPIQHPRQYFHPIPTMSDVQPSSSGLQQLNTNRHSEIHSDSQGTRSLSLARQQTPFTAIQPVSYPRCLGPTPTMTNGESSSSGLRPTNLFNPGATGVRSAQTGGGGVGESRREPLFNRVAESYFRGSTDQSLESLLTVHLTMSSNKSLVSNPRKGRKEITGSSQSMGSCQCKKIKCMKLYCECFASSFYCSETCSCKGCLNKKERDEEVHEARETVVSRNPLAFSPRVVPYRCEPSSSSYGGDGTHASPSSSRHIRGCNCKKSMCLKNYCDCYQSKVRCSNGCHCEGCQNVYGPRKEEGTRRGPLSGEENNQGTGSPFSDSFHTTAPANDSHNTHLGTNQNSTPPPPPLPPSQEEDTSNIWSSLQNDMELPDSSFHLDDNYSAPETARETLDQLSSGQTPGLGNAETNDEFEFPPGAILEVPDLMDWTRFPIESSHFSGASHQNWWLGSRISPLLDFGEPMIANEHESHNILIDDQPQPLWDPPMSLNMVQVNSQSRKRVSSPRDPVQEFGSSAPAGSAKSTPAPPDQHMEDPEDRGGSK